MDWPSGSSAAQDVMLIKAKPTWLNIGSVQRLFQSAQLIVLDHLLQAELEVVEQHAQLLPVGLPKLRALQVQRGHACQR